MSFDLDFCLNKTDEKLVREKLVNFLSNQQNFAEFKSFDDNSFEIWYENKSTKVYCSFHFDSTICLKGEEIYDEYKLSGLYFNMNYNRPNFYAIECLPIVETVSKFFNLIIYDPQEDKMIQSKETPISEILIESWIKHNSSTMHALIKQSDFDVYYLNEQSSNLWWKYTFLKEKLENKVNEEIYVPVIMLLCNDAGEVFTVLLWPENIPQFFPVSDYILIKRFNSKLFGFRKEEEISIIKYSELIEIIDPFLEMYDKEINLKLLNPSQTKSTEHIFNNLKLKPFDLKKHGEITPGRFQNVIERKIDDKN